MGGGGFVVNRDGVEEESQCGIGDVVTLWDGEAACYGLTALKVGGTGTEYVK